MTDAERRIIEFLYTWNPTRLADLPDWFLALLKADDEGELSHELITAASLMLLRREQPGIKFGRARELLAGYTNDPAKLEELGARITAFRLSCCFERLKRAGQYEEVSIDDPFDPDGQVWVRLREEDWRLLKAKAAAEEERSSRQRRCDRH
jgi:hypothetical protein